MKQIFSILVVLALLIGVIPVSEGTLIASPGTIIGSLSEGQSQTYALDNGDKYVVAAKEINGINHYVNLNINGKSYQKLLEYDRKLRTDGTYGYDIGNNNEIIIISIADGSSQTNTASRVQFAIARKKGVYASPYEQRSIPEPKLAPAKARAYPQSAAAPVEVAIQPSISCESTCKQAFEECMTQEMVGIEQICEPKYNQCLSSCKQQPVPTEPPQQQPQPYNLCEGKYKSCVNYYNDEAVCSDVLKYCQKQPPQTPVVVPPDYSQPVGCESTCNQEYEKCMQQEMVGIEQVCKPIYKQCLSSCRQQPVPPVEPGPLPPCDRDYNNCVKQDRTNPELMYKCKLAYQTCIGKPVQEPVCGNNVCESYEEKICPKDCGVVYDPPKPEQCATGCKDSYSYCLQSPALIFGDLWIQKFGDESLKIGAKVVDDGGPATPEEGTEVIVHLSNGEDIKLLYDSAVAYYYSEALNQFTLAQRGVSGEQKIRGEARKAGYGAIALDAVIDFSERGEEIEYNGVRSFWIRTKSRSETVIEQPGENFRAEREKVCRGYFDSCTQGCGYQTQPFPTVPSIPSDIVCDNSCYSESLSKCIPYGIRLVEKETPLYCGISGELEKQKVDSSDAQNSYECASNFASDGKCVAVKEQLSILQKIMRFFTSIFGGT